jgi:hypothetical protein
VAVRLRKPSGWGERCCLASGSSPRRDEVLRRSRSTGANRGRWGEETESVSRRGDRRYMRIHEGRTGGRDPGSSWWTPCGRQAGGPRARVGRSDGGGRAKGTSVRKKRRPLLLGTEKGMAEQRKEVCDVAVRQGWMGQRERKDDDSDRTDGLSPSLVSLALSLAPPSRGPAASPETLQPLSRRSEFESCAGLPTSVQAAQNGRCWKCLTLVSGDWDAGPLSHHS